MRDSLTSVKGLESIMHYIEEENEDILYVVVYYCVCSQPSLNNYDESSQFTLGPSRGARRVLV